MASRYISEEMRRLVANRASRICEYCLIAETDTFLSCQVDHIISLKHGGLTQPDNLAYSCAICNRNKGSDVGSIVPQTEEFVRFFNPRRDAWADHFILDKSIIQPQTKIGEATARILEFNSSERILEREALIAAKKYPSPPALQRMRK